MGDSSYSSKITSYYHKKIKKFRKFIKLLYKTQKNSRILINKNFLITKVNRESLNVNIVHIIGEGTKK